jgi:phosphatidylglycerophosphatase C
VIALFDLDGTITRGDTLWPYVWGYLRRRPRRLGGLVHVLPTLARFALGRADRGALKSALIRATLGGSGREELAAWTDAYVARIEREAVHSEARRRIERHRAAGDLLVLLSASPDLYVPELARALGFDAVVCTELTWQDGRLEGQLLTPNRRAEEKERCLAQLQEEHPSATVAAYANAASDIPHLRMAQRPLLVNGNRAARRLARRYGIPCARWR